MHPRDQNALDGFFDNEVPKSTLGLMYGRRRIGKSTELVRQVRARAGFYFEATNVGSPILLERLGRELGEHLGVGRLALADWDDAIAALTRLGVNGPTPVVLDEFGHILTAEPSVASVIAKAFGPGSAGGGTIRLMLCGSAIALMRSLTQGEAALRGRAGVEIVVQPDDYRETAARFPEELDLPTVTKLFAVIGGVVGYATDMVDFDLPKSDDDFDRWVVQRVLSNAATLRHEATTLLAEDPTVSGKASTLHHGILSAIANGSVSAGKIAKRVGRQVPNIAPALNRLVDAGFVLRSEDPIRDQRPMYALGDSYLQFYFGVLEPNGQLLRDRDPTAAWTQRLRDLFGSTVRGPVFEEQARTWVRRFAVDSTLKVRDFTGSSVVSIDGVEHELDLVVAGPGDLPGSRDITAIGEAKAGELITRTHLRKLELARTALGGAATDAKLFLVGSKFDRTLKTVSVKRPDVELVDLERLYFGS